jgi:hypothetical protein
MIIGIIKISQHMVNYRKKSYDILNAKIKIRISGIKNNKCNNTWEKSV